MSNSEGWLEFKAYTILIGEMEWGKALIGKKIYDFFGKRNEFSGEQTKDKKVCDNICPCRSEWSFHTFQDDKTPLENRFWVSFELFLWE